MNYDVKHKCCWSIVPGEWLDTIQVVGKSNVLVNAVLHLKTHGYVDIIYLIVDLVKMGVIQQLVWIDSW